MGGHGGLNILPQKSWNVYGRENRLKVARDEAKHAEEQRAKLDKQRLAESEVRRAHLLQQAALKRLGTEPDDSAEQGQLPEPDQQEEPEQQEQPALLQHINFFEEHEARDAHPEVAEEAKKEARRRGDAATQTSDARFDERFQLGYGLGGGSAQPWYAQPKAQQLLSDAAGGTLLEDDGRPLTLSGRAGPATFGAPLLIGSSGNERREKKRGKTDRKEKKGSKKGHKEGRGHKGEKKKGLDIEKLRQERLQRERQERDRARQAIMGNIASAENGKKYNASYGNAAPVMRTQ